MSDTKSFAGVKPEQFDFDKLEAEDAHKMKHLGDWPDWVQTGLGYVQRALNAVGVTVDFANIKDPGEYVADLIGMIKASPSLSPLKWVALAALIWLKNNLPAADVVKALQGA